MTIFIKVLKGIGILFLCISLVITLIFAVHNQNSSGNNDFHIDEQLSLGLKFLNEGEFERAVKVILPVIEAEPYLGKAVLAAAEAYKEQGKYNLSSDYYEKALEMNQMDIGLWTKLENSLIFSKETERLKEFYQRSILLFPSRNTHLEKLVYLCMTTDDKNFLRGLMDHMEGNNPLHPSVKYGYQAYILLEEGRVEEAEELLFQQKVFDEIKKSNARLYFGEYNGNGEADGMGICFYNGDEEDTDIYIGEWRNGRREGVGKAFSSYGLSEQEQGRMEIISFQTILDGSFREDRAEGDCTLTRSYKNGENHSLSVISAEFCAGQAKGRVIMEQYQDSGISLKQEHQVREGQPYPFKLNNRGISEDVYEVIYLDEDLLAYSNEPCSCIFTWD